MHVPALRLRLIFLLVIFTAVSISAQTTTDNPPKVNRAPQTPGCFSGTTGEVGGVGRSMVHGIVSLPRHMAKASNLKWEVPVAVAAGLMAYKGDTSIARHVTSTDLVDASRNFTNVGLVAEIAGGAGTFLVGCAGHHPHARNAGLTSLEAMALALGEAGVAKVAFNREYPTSHNAEGDFWAGGRSFPSGHSAISWAFASVIAHEYPHNRLVKWSAYGLATGVSVLRIAGRKHFPSDVIIGGTLGYVTGTYLASHSR